jgi:FkbM family methyltransferase
MRRFLKEHYVPAVLNLFDADLPAAVAIFGAGGRGRRCLARLGAVGVAVVCFADNDPARQGQYIDGIEVVPPGALRERLGERPVVVCSFAAQAIVAQLLAQGIADIRVDALDGCGGPGLEAMLASHLDDLEAVYDRLADDASRATYARAVLQRFRGAPPPRPADYPLYAHPEVRPAPGDVIIDGGAAPGDVIDRFHRLCRGECTIHAFEPTPAGHAALEGHIRANGLEHCARAVNLALWDREACLPLRVTSEAGLSNHVTEAARPGDVTVSAVTLDGYAATNGLARIDCIKLDVEGAERAALAGARRTIAACKPKLQVCLYHQPRDFWEIPAWIAGLVPEYRMFIGQHSCSYLDLVLYCAL